MLEGIDEERFGKASHAYGKAKDVPQLLRGLLAKTEKARDQALFGLSSAICHQGTLYSATPLAVPHLLELVGSPKVKGRAGILRLLGDIVTLDDHVPFLLGYPDAPPSDLPAAFKRSILAVRNGSDVIVGLLRDGDEEVRSAAAFLLAWMPKSNAPAVAAALKKERSDSVKVSLALALGFLGEVPSAIGRATELQTAVALATATAKKGDLDERARALIIAAAAKKKMRVEGMLFVGGDLAVFAVHVLAALPEANDALIGAIEAGGVSTMFAANVVVRRIFEARGKAPAKKYQVARRDQEEERVLAELPVKPADLDPLQRRFVNALAKAKDDFDRALQDALGERGLPPSKDLVIRWLTGATEAKKTLLDRAATLAGKATTLGDLYTQATVPAGEPKPEIIAAIESHTTVDERIELALLGLDVVEVSWSGNVALELIWRNAPKASKEALAALPKIAKKRGLYAVAVGLAHASRALAAGKPAEPEVDALLQHAYEYSVMAKRGLAALPIARREKWILHEKRDDRAQPAEFFSGAWKYFDACPTTKIADRALAHVAQWKPKDPWGKPRKSFGDPVLKALADAFRAAGNEADAKRLEEAYAKLK